MARRPLPPGPPGHVLVGHLPELRRDMLGFFTRCAREYGDVVALRFGPEPGVLLSHPDHIRQVLVTERRNFVKNTPYRLVGRVTGEGILLAEGEHWQRQRRLMQPAFHHQQIASYADTMVSYTRRTIDRWNDGRTLDLHEAMMRLTLEIVSKVLFDADVSEGTEAEAGEAIEASLDSLDRLLTSLSFLLPERVPTPSNVRLRKAVRRLDRVVYGIIEGRRSSDADRGDLLSLLLQARHEDGHRMSERQVRDETMTLFLAGHETTAIALTWAWHMLAVHREAQIRLLEEIDSVLGDGPPHVTDLPRLPYTRHVVRETLRLYPPAFALGRKPLRDCEIGGYRVARGTNVVMSPWVVHRDDRFFDEPEAFRPERWEGGLEKHLPRLAYFPFGAGQRLCLGSEFAMMEAMLILATISQRYAMDPAPGHRAVPDPVLTLRPRHGMPMVLRRRVSSRDPSRTAAETADLPTSRHEPVR